MSDTPKLSPEQDRRVKRIGAGALLLGLVGAAVATACSRSSGDYETCMLPPGQNPEGEGWRSLNAVTHTSLYGGLMGKPVGRVVWERRRRMEADESLEQPFFVAVGGSSGK